MGACCFLPPLLLERLVLHGDPQQRALALRTLATDASLRSARLQTGVLARRTVRASTGLQRSIFDAGGLEEQPGRLVRVEGQGPVGDAAADEAYDGLGATYRLLAEEFGRDSLDDQGLPLVATVHYGEDYDNAFWDGEQMVFGDGDGQVFLRFTLAVDVIGHELAHGMVQDEAALAYQGQSGALNESVADVFGALVKQHALGQRADQADWLIGAGLLAPGVGGVALRSMAAPGTAYDDPVLGKDPQPAHMDDLVRTATDNGGVHINSGIPNRAFHLAATALGGYSWERAGRVWYDALRDPALTPTATFTDFVAATLRAAGPGEVRDAVAGAWAVVGLS